MKPVICFSHLSPAAAVKTKKTSSLIRKGLVCAAGKPQLLSLNKDDDNHLHHVCGIKVKPLSLYRCSLVSIIRGQVLTADGTPLIGVNVTFLHYPEHGHTVTRKDGL